MIHLVLLSGGSGTRLWPLSNDARSKQFLKVLRDEKGNHVSMVQRVFSQIRHVDANIDITIATCENQANSIKSQISDGYELVLEPERRDTAPAIMLACAHLAFEQGAHCDDPVVVMPIDTYADQEYYDSIPLLAEAAESGMGDLILLGVNPTYPSEKYGYIVPAADGEGAKIVERFVEKPAKSVAEALISKGALWNCGVFAFKLGWLMALQSAYCGAGTYQELASRYGELPKNSFDYEVVEKARNIAVIPYDGEWKDLGTWNTLTEEMADPYAGRAVVDDTTCSNVHVINETGFPMVVAGLHDAVVVATPDGILVSGKKESAGIKTQVQKAAESRPMYEHRRWGEYRVLGVSVFPGGSKALVKELVVNPGCQLSYQKHIHRSEIWTVVSGEGEVVLDGQVQPVSEGSVIQIEAGRLHSARAIKEMHVIEVQTGAILIESDIERFGDFWE